MVSVIILSYNTAELLSKCLKALYTQVTDVSYEVIVVDNASQDTSVQFVKKNFKDVRLIESKENLGFAKGVNLGAKQAKGEYLIFLNSDTELQSGFVQMIEEFARQKDAGIIGGKFENVDGTYQSSTGSFYTIFAVIKLLVFGERFNAKKIENSTHAVDWVSGGFMLISKALFEKLHGFDEHFFMYIEDTELCFRARKLGFKAYYSPHGVVRHIGQGSSNRSFAIVQIFSGLRYFYRKHYSLVSYILLEILLRLKAYIAICVGTITRNAYLTATYKKVLSRGV